jgi:4-amino-4-deoxy-L-arabinose transferase-like glycosyltransferase
MNQKKLKIIFLVSGISVYSLLALLIWHDRFYYDDEWINLRIISKYSFSEIISFTSIFDFHPPLQYIINKIAYSLFGPGEWLVSLPSILSTGLAAGLAGIIVYDMTCSKAFSFSYACFKRLSQLSFRP